MKIYKETYSWGPVHFTVEKTKRQTDSDLIHFRSTWERDKQIKETQWELDLVMLCTEDIAD